MGKNWLLEQVKMTDVERFLLMCSSDEIVTEVDKKIAKGMIAHNAVIEVVEERLKLLRKKEE